MSMPAVGPLVGLTGTFLKIGCVFFGGGFVLVPLLHQHLVTNLRYLTEREFLDGVAISNLTPGPIAVLATFASFSWVTIPSIRKRALCRYNWLAKGG
jgi:chromate transporter